MKKIYFLTVMILIVLSSLSSVKAELVTYPVCTCDFLNQCYERIYEKWYLLGFIPMYSYQIAASNSYTCNSGVCPIAACLNEASGNKNGSNSWESKENNNFNYSGSHSNEDTSFLEGTPKPDKNDSFNELEQLDSPPQN